MGLRLSPTGGHGVVVKAKATDERWGASERATHEALMPHHVPTKEINSDKPGPTIKGNTE